MLKSFINKYKDSRFFKDVLHLMSGTFIGQFIVVAVTPILSRYFSPDDFGLLALFISLHAILVIIGTGKLEITIMLPKKKKDAFKIVVLMIYQALALAIFLYFLLFLFKDYISVFEDIKKISNVLYLLPLTMFFMTANTALKFLKNRLYKYKEIRNRTIVEGATRGGFNVLIGMINPLSVGLIYGYFLALLVSFIYWLKNEFNELINTFKTFRFKDVQIITKTYKHIYTHVVTGAFINSFAAQMPIFLITYYYTVDMVGQFSMAQRLISIPLIFILKAYADSFRQKAADKYKETGDIRSMFVVNLKRLLVIGIVPFIILGIFAPIIFSVFLGNEWEFAGVIVRVLVLMSFFNFVIMGLSAVVIQIAEFFKFELYWQISFFILSIGGFFIGHYIFNDILYSLFFYSVGCIIMYFVSFAIAYKYSVKKN